MSDDDGKSVIESTDTDEKVSDIDNLASDVIGEKTVDSEVSDSEEDDDFVVGERRTVRSIIFHLLYAMESSDYLFSPESILDNFNRELETDIPLNGEAVDIAKAVAEHRIEIDKKIEPLLVNWRLERLGCCTCLILRFAIWELMYTDTATSIVINEAIELSKCFSEKDAYKFVNGLLDVVAKEVRQSDKPSDA